jgi:hypothetical protein
MTDPTTTTTTEWGVEYRWPDGSTQTQWHGDDRLQADLDIRCCRISESRTETARLVIRTTTVIVTPKSYVDDAEVSPYRNELYDNPATAATWTTSPATVAEFDLSPLDDDPTVVVPADTFTRAPR